MGGGIPEPDLDGGRVPGVPPSQVWMVGGTWGTPSPSGLDEVTPPPPNRRSSIVSICYTVDGMPLVFNQEDFLVNIFGWSTYNRRK